MTRVLYLYGGWPGHKPYEIANEWALPLFKELGFDVDQTNDVFALDADLTGYDLIALNWNNALLSEGLSVAQEDGLLRAVEAGTGIAAWHGAAAAFRTSIRYHLMLGGSFLEHPAGEGVKDPYRVSIVDRDSEITRGVADFDVASEQYYLSLDPNNHVLAETEFTGEHVPWLAGRRMPQAWTRTWGAGRVFYSAVGHDLDDLRHPDVTRLCAQGFAWAARRTA
ncbi:MULTISPECIES: ThuA domain-containing protein [unclassified Amycolatopsis]|uniref:ThuA domain-containing protein n=1 Tax=unclassified Amycolatopsis TaxID=2618356 RepID=UPI00106EF70C|nr:MULTISPECIES: ThuA domain-containing protein [unclassified Amycolatopsis]